MICQIFLILKIIFSKYYYSIICYAIDKGNQDPGLGDPWVLKVYIQKTCHFDIFSFNSVTQG